MSSKFYEQFGVAMTCRSYDEYVRMFALDSRPVPPGEMLDVAAGASSFAAEANVRGRQVIAVDPLYEMEPAIIARHGEAEIATSTAKLAGLADQLDWTFYGDLDRHRAMRERSLQRFIADFEKYKGQRYISSRLPELPFADGRFGLVLCSHFLFLYQEQLDDEFHLRAIRELLRVCRRGGEVRIYPLSTLRWTRYPDLESLLEPLAAEGVQMAFARSELPFIPGSTELLVLSRA